MKPTPDPQQTSDIKPDGAGLGGMIRARRLQVGITMTELARRSELSVPFLSQVEKGTSGLSLTSLLRIAQALGVSLNFFVSPAVSSAPVRRPQDLQFFTLDGSRIRHARLGSVADDRQLEPLLLVIPPRYESEPFRHLGEEFFYVRQGRLTIHIGEETFTLEEGHTAHFNSGVRHRWRNDGDEEVHLVWVGTPPMF